MKAVLAIITSLLVYVVIFFITTLILVAICWTAERARHGGGINILTDLIYFITVPGCGGFFAIYSVGVYFKSVKVETVFVSFVTLFALFMLITIISGLYRVISEEKKELWNLILIMILFLSTFGGAYIGKNYPK